MMFEKDINKIHELYRSSSKDEAVAERELIESIMAHLDKGKVRAAFPENGKWKVNEWVKEAILLYFRISENREMQSGASQYYDKIELKSDFKSMGVRAVPGAIVRFGSFLEKGVIAMPSFVNIGAYVGAETMIDTWATIGSCAQVGSRVHISGGVGIGGVLEPIQAAPVIVEDDCFIGSRCILVEGAMVGRGAVLGAGVVVTGSSKIIDTTCSQPIETTGYIPPYSVVIPGTRTKTFAAGEYQVPCALIIGKRNESTDVKVSLNSALREFEIDG